MENSLEKEFERAMLDIVEKEKSELRRNPSYFLRMIEGKGGLQAAKDLLAKEYPSEGFVKVCWDLERPDLTAECLALNPKFRGIFTERELRNAREWLGPHANECESS